MDVRRRWGGAGPDSGRPHAPPLAVPAHPAGCDAVRRRWKADRALTFSDHGADGLDEISTTGYTKISECRDGSVNTFYLHPSDVRIPKASPETLRGGGADANAEIALDVLAGGAGAPRDIVLLNAGAALFIAGAVSSISDGLVMAADALDSGRAADVLATLVRVSNTSPEVARV